MRDEADSATLFGFIATYLGDTLWAVMFFFLFATGLFHWKSWALGLLTLGFTISIELSQLYHGEPLASLRRFPPTRFLLGTNFLWSDLICLTIGSLLAIAIHAVIQNRRPRARLMV
jgi:VanZ family protein